MKSITAATCPGIPLWRVYANSELGIALFFLNVQPQQETIGLQFCLKDWNWKGAHVSGRLSEVCGPAERAGEACNNPVGGG
jgi:hypothetical protein